MPLLFHAPGDSLPVRRIEHVADAMRERLLARARKLRVRQYRAEAADEQTLEILRSLGYLQ